MSYISVNCEKVRGLNKKREVIEIDNRLARIIKEHIEIMHDEGNCSIVDELYFYCEIEFNGSEFVYIPKSASEYDASVSNIFTMGKDRIVEVSIDIKHIGAGLVLCDKFGQELLPIYEINIRHFESAYPDCNFYFTPEKKFIIFIGSQKVDMDDLIDVPIENI